MSEKTKAELRVAIATILITVTGSLIATVWYSAQLAHRVAVNTDHLKRIDKKIEKMAEIILKEKK